MTAAVVWLLVPGVVLGAPVGGPPATPTPPDEAGEASEVAPAGDDAAPPVGPAPAPESAPATGDPPEPPGDADAGPDAAETEPATDAEPGVAPEPAPDAKPEPADAGSASPATLSDGAPPPPGTPTAAVGAGGQTPLPAAPPPEDPSKLQDHAWRGRFELLFTAGVIGSVAGQRPARGTVVSAFGALGFGVRVHPIVSVDGSVTTFVHDVERATLVDAETGEDVTEQGFGRVTLVDLGGRVHWPAARRIEPFLGLHGGIGLRRQALTGDAAFAGAIRTSAGVDFWLGPTFTIGAEFTYRTLFVQRTVGHGLQGGARFAVHW